MAIEEKVQIQASHWVSLENEGENLQENKYFISWINENPKHQKAYEKEKELIREVRDLPENFLNELKAEVKKDRENINKKKSSKKILLNTFAPLASAACVLFVLYFSFFRGNIKFSKQYLALNKIQKDIILPDSSKITLDVNTKIDVKYYDNKREISLSKGKAVFDVESNKQRPFVIKTGKVDITVLGTKFEVINKEKQTQVNVTEGVVKVTNPYAHDSLLVRVEKGQSVTLDKYSNIKPLKKIDINKTALWSEGKFSFYQESIENITKEFSKYIDIDVKIKNKKIALLPVSGNFSADSFDDFLKVLPLVHPLVIEKKEGKIIIKDKKI